MIWQDRRKAGLIIGLVLLLFACEHPNEIGLELDPDRNKVGLFYTEFVLPVKVINTDSLETDFSTQLLFGTYSDMNFGDLKCTSFTQVMQNLFRPGFTAEDVFDSLVFSFDLSYHFGSDIGLPQKYYVHQLEENLSDTTSYYTFSKIMYAVTPMGENTIIIDPDVDTVFSIKANDDFGQEFWDVVTDTTKMDWGDNDVFTEYFKGIALVSDQNNNSVLGFNTSSENTKLSVFYHNENDTTQYDFVLSGVTNFNQILSDKTGTPLAPIEDQYYTEFMPVDGRSYMQAGTGMVLKIDLDPLTSFVDTIENLIVNAATIEIPVKSIAYNVNPPNFVHFYFTDSTNRRLKFGLAFLAILEEGTSSILTVANDSTGSYNGRVTIYIEDLIRGVNVDHQLLVYPTVFEQTQSVNQAIIDPETIKLKLYYTALK